MSCETPTVILIEDHPLCRKGVTDLLQSPAGGMKVIAALNTIEGALELIRAKAPDLVLIDLRIGSGDGLELLAECRKAGITTRFAILTMSEEKEHLATALRLGANGYFLKDMDPEDLLKGIQRAARGELVVAPEMASKLAAILQEKDSPRHANTPLAALTERELEILGYLANGKSNKEIARYLAISPDTVKLHVRHILAKLGLTSRVEAAVLAVKYGVTGQKSQSV
ncbi:response regulator [Hydrogenophilus thiooxidans]|uniref:response regulator n=1 Tax=Hydrogenophilus thiooxidans TaxID=2820326 RepID=UPI001C21CE01|nr:response regulator [Hydrogenophilus thiooxidans]